MNGISKNPFLSICIPTYNRAEYVFSMVKDILRCPSDEIEVVILDNCSTDETKSILSRINDNRFVFKQNPQNIGGILNSVKVLTVAKGKFALLCLDKDYIDSQFIMLFIESLKKDNEVVFGNCNLDLKQQIQDVTFEKGFDSVVNMAYSSRHPSGIFYDTGVLKKLKIIEEIDKVAKFPLIHELINAEASFFGKSKRVNIALISASYLNSKGDFAVNKTQTYNTGNYYFLPNQRMFEYLTYMERTSALNLSLKEKRYLYKAIFFQGLISCTYGYKKDIADTEICAHYGIFTKRISFLDLLVIDYNYFIFFLKHNIEINIFSKTYIYLYANCKLAQNIVKSILKKKQR